MCPTAISLWSFTASPPGERRLRTARLIASLAELDARRHYLAEGYACRSSHLLHTGPAFVSAAAYVRMGGCQDHFAPQVSGIPGKSLEEAFSCGALRDGWPEPVESTPRPVCPLDCRESDGRGRHADT